MKGNPESSLEIWRIGNRDTGVLIKNADDLLPYLPYYIAGWDISRLSRPEKKRADFSVVRLTDGTYQVFCLEGSKQNTQPHEPHEAAGLLANCLIKRFVCRKQRMIYLNAAALKIGKNLVILDHGSIPHEWGLALELTALGCRLFGNQKIGLSLEKPYSVVALGLMPQISLPLDDKMTETSREFIDTYAVLKTDKKVFLKLWDRECAVFGENQSLTAVIVLTCKKSGHAALTTAAVSDIVARLASVSFAPSISAAQLSEFLGSIAKSTDRYELQYSNLREAASLIKNRFSVI